MSLVRYTYLIHDFNVTGMGPETIMYRNKRNTSSEILIHGGSNMSVPLLQI